MGKSQGNESKKRTEKMENETREKERIDTKKRSSERDSEKGKR